MDFDVTRFGFYNAGLANQAKRLDEKQGKKVEQAEETTQAAEMKEAEGDGLAALSFQNIAGIKLSKKVDENTAADLTEMFQMAGISQKYMPSQEVYARISSATLNTGKDIEEVETEGNAEQLFASKKFQDLNDAFGID